MHTKLFRRPMLLLGAAFLLSAACGCSDDDDDTGVDPDTPFPAMRPSGETMRVDTSDLATDGLTLESTPQLHRDASASGICHAASAFVVAWTNLNVVLRLSIPALLLDTTLQAQPTYVGDETWRWTASGGTGMDAWTAELEGRIDGEPAFVAWTMRVSGTRLGLDRFVWYTGTSQMDAEGGTWRFYDPLDAEEPGEVFFVGWEEDVSDRALIVFENRDDGTDEFEDLLTYERDGDLLSLEYFDRSANATTRIEWDRTTGEGQTTDAEGMTCCWGPRPSYDDVDCP